MKLKIVALLIALVALAGCSKRTIVGTWDTQYQSFPATITFKPDGTFQADITAGEAKGKAIGTYTLEKENITLQPQDVTVQGLPDIVADQVKQGVAKGMTLKGAIEWVSDDEFRYKDKDLTFRREAKR